MRSATRCPTLHIVALTFALSCLSIGAAGATGTAEETVPDAGTFVLEHFNGTAGGVPFGPPTYAPSIDGLGEALESGLGTYVKYPLAGGPRGQGTIEMWIYPEDLDEPVVGLLDFNWYNTGSYPGSGHIMQLTVDNRFGSVLTYGAWAVGGLKGTTAIPIREWTHVAFSWGSAGSKLYVNGVIEDQTPANLAPRFNTNPYAYLNFWGGPESAPIDRAQA